MIALSAEQGLALAFCGARYRQAFSLLLQFDRSLGRAVQQQGPPVAGQLRLAWWREQIADLHIDRGANLVLTELARLLTAEDSARQDLSRMIDGWEVLLVNDDLSDENLLQYAKERGGGLFCLAAKVAGSGEDTGETEAGIVWALVDLARHCSDPVLANRVIALARAHIRSARQLSRHLRPFALLAHFAECDVVRGSERLLPAGSPRRIVQAWRFSLGLG